MPRALRLLPLIAASALAAAAPDRAPLAEEWGYRPAEGVTVAVNPPSLTWVHERDAASYDLEWSTRPDFTGAEAARRLPWSVAPQPARPGPPHGHRRARPHPRRRGR